MHVSNFVNMRRVRRRKPRHFNRNTEWPQFAWRKYRSQITALSWMRCTINCKVDSVDQFCVIDNFEENFKFTALAPKKPIHGAIPFVFSLVLIGGLTQFSYAKILKEYCFPTAPFLPLPQRSSSRKSTSQQTNSKWSQQNCMQVERLTRWILIAIVSMDFHSLLANCGRFVLLFASLWDLLRQPTTTHTGILLIVLTHTHLCDLASSLSG